MITPNFAMASFYKCTKTASFYMLQRMQNQGCN